MAAPALQRSSVSFRRQGSSGLVWDDRLFSGELAQYPTKPEVKPEIEVHDAVKLPDAVPTDVEAPVRTPTGERKDSKKKRSNNGRETDGPATAPAAADRGSATKRTSCGCCGILQVNSHRPRKAKGMTKRR